MASDELEVTELDPSDAIGGIQPDEVVEVDDTEVRIFSGWERFRRDLVM